MARVNGPNIDPETGLSRMGRPKKSPPPAPGSTEALIAELESAKKELIALNDLCVDNQSKLANAEGIRKIVLSITQIRLSDAKAKSLAQDQKISNDFAYKESLAEIRVSLLGSLRDPLAAAFLWVNIAADADLKESVPGWIADQLTAKERIEAGLDAAPLVEKEEVMGIWTKPVPRRGAA